VLSIISEAGTPAYATSVLKMRWSSTRRRRRSDIGPLRNLRLTPVRAAYRVLSLASHRHPARV